MKKIIDSMRQGGTFLVRGYHCYYATAEKQQIAFDKRAAENRNMLSFSVYHVGGTSQAKWVVDVAKTGDEEPVNLSFNGTDMHVIHFR